MRIELLFPGKTKEPYLADGIEEYRKRLRHYVQLDLCCVKETRKKGNRTDAQLKEEEGKLLLGRINRPAFIVALDCSGRQFQSEGMAELLTKWQGQGLQRIAFVIGGPLGLSPLVLKEADLVLSLSSMTFTHEMARLLLLEQLYRAYTIIAGTGYHK